MRDSKKEYNLWFIILIACAVSKSTAKYGNSINALLDKLYWNEGLSDKRIIDRSNQINKKSLLNESKTASTTPQLSENLAGPGFKLDNPPRTPILFCMAQIPPINENTLLNFSKVEIKNARLINGTGNVYDLTRVNDGHSTKKNAIKKNNRLEKNHSLMESILNPFFLKAFKSHEIASQTNQTNATKISNSSAEFRKLDTSYSNDSLDKLTLTELTSAKYNSLNEDFLLVNKPPQLLYSKQQSIIDNLESPYYWFKSGNGRNFKIFARNQQNGFNGRKMGNKSRLALHQTRNKNGNIISKPVKLVDMVKSRDSMGTLLNQTLLNFSSQIFSILQDEKPIKNSVEDGTSNKFWNQIKKKFIGVNRRNHNNLAYELLRNGNGSDSRW